MDLKGAEIFSVGTWNGLTFGQDDLDAIVESFNELAGAGRVPLKFGHNQEQPLTDGQPALGWVQRVWTEGGKLLADFASLPSQVYEAIKQGLYKFVSVELLHDVEREGRTSPWVLDAVALLGADPPAVRNLQDLQALTMSRVPGLRYGSRVAFALVDDTSSIIRRPKGMSENNVTPEQLQKLTDAVGDLQGKVATFSADNATLKAENAQLRSEIERRDAEKRAAEISGRRTAIKAKFEDAVKRRVLSPASRDLFFKMQGVDDDARVVACTDEVISAYIDLNGRKDSSTRAAFTRQPGDEGTHDDTQVDAEVAEQVSAELEKHESITHRDAMIRVFRRNPELGRRYMFQRDAN